MSAKKCSLFNNFFAKQCTVLEPGSRLPPQSPITGKVLKQSTLTDSQLSKRIIDLISGFNVNKAHGHDGLSIRMLKLCSDSLSKPLTKILRNCLDSGYFPQSWKKGNVIPIHKKK